MTQQYIRKASLIVGISNQQVLDLSQMQFSFEVDAMSDFTQTPKTAFVRVYNLSQQTINTIVNEGSNLQLVAGYEGNYGAIFNGQIIQVRKGKDNAIDSYLDITAADSDFLYNQGFLNFTLASGTDHIGRLGQIANNLGVKLGTVQAPSGQKLSRGVSYYGLAKDHLRSAASSIGASWHISEGHLDVVTQSGYKAGEIPVITSLTGMIGLPEETPLGVFVTTLLNPSIEQNMLVQLDNKSIQQYAYANNNIAQAAQVLNVSGLSADGRYKVLFVNHIGDTRGNDWYSQFICYNKWTPGANAYMPVIN